jgi:hypothetical protein
MPSRRDFLSTTLAAVGAAALRPELSWAQRARKTVLILGGAGMTFRSIEVTARDTLDWFRTLPADRQAGLLRGLEREAQVIAEWKARRVA